MEKVLGMDSLAGNVFLSADVFMDGAKMLWNAIVVQLKTEECGISTKELIVTDLNVRKVANMELVMNPMNARKQYSSIKFVKGR